MRNINSSTTMSDDDSHTDDSDSSLLLSDEEPAPIFLNGRESGEPLLSLYNSTSRRKKTIDNYVAPVELRDTVVRRKEYPNGVYIDKLGKVCPNDKRSGIYKLKPAAGDSDYRSYDVSDPDDPEYKLSDQSSEETESSESDDENEQSFDRDTTTVKVAGSAHGEYPAVSCNALDTDQPEGDISDDTPVQKKVKTHHVVSVENTH